MKGKGLGRKRGPRNKVKNLSPKAVKMTEKH